MALRPQNRQFSIIFLLLLMSLQLAAALGEQQEPADIPLAAPITTTSAGTGGIIAVQSVARVLCLTKNTGGTGFLHKSGHVITAEHVVSDCPELVVLPAREEPIKATVSIVDAELDLAVLTLAKKFATSALPLSSSSQYSIGAQVTTWGFPGGYRGRSPLLSVGYLAGVEAVLTKSGKQTSQWVVNAAFNLGNSGGPLIDIETGSVIGVVSSKLAPVPKFVEKGIKALDDLKFGVMFTVTKPDGTTEQMPQGRVIAEVMQHLRSQVQLVIGKAVRVEDLRNLLKQNGIEP